MLLLKLDFRNVILYIADFPLNLKSFCAFWSTSLYRGFEVTMNPHGEGNCNVMLLYYINIKYYVLSMILALLQYL